MASFGYECFRCGEVGHRAAECIAAFETEELDAMWLAQYNAQQLDESISLEEDEE